MAKKTIRSLKADNDAVKDGVHCEHTGSKFLLAYAGRGNPRHQVAWDRATKPYRALLAHAEPEQAREINEAIALEVFTNAMLIGWENVSKDALTGNDADSETPLPFNEENAKALMKELQFLYDDLWTFAHNRANYLIGDPDEDAKN